MVGVDAFIPQFEGAILNRSVSTFSECWRFQDAKSTDVHASSGRIEDLQMCFERLGSLRGSQK